MGFGMAVTSAGPYPNNLHLTSDRDNHTNIKSHDFYRPDALTDAQPTVSRHCRPKLLVTFQETFAPGAIAYQWSVCGGR